MPLPLSKVTGIVVVFVLVVAVALLEKNIAWRGLLLIHVAVVGMVQANVGQKFGKSNIL